MDWAPHISDRARATVRRMRRKTSHPHDWRAGNRDIPSAALGSLVIGLHGNVAVDTTGSNQCVRSRGSSGSWAIAAKSVHRGAIHSMISSARATSAGGRSRPMARAVTLLRTDQGLAGIHQECPRASLDLLAAGPISICLHRLIWLNPAKVRCYDIASTNAAMSAYSLKKRSLPLAYFATWTHSPLTILPVDLTLQVYVPITTTVSSLSIKSFGVNSVNSR